MKRTSAIAAVLAAALGIASALAAAPAQAQILSNQAEVAQRQAEARGLPPGAGPYSYYGGGYGRHGYYGGYGRYASNRYSAGRYGYGHRHVRYHQRHAHRR